MQKGASKEGEIPASLYLTHLRYGFPVFRGPDSDLNVISPSKEKIRNQRRMIFLSRFESKF